MPRLMPARSFRAWNVVSNPWRINCAAKATAALRSSGVAAAIAASSSAGATSPLARNAERNRSGESAVAAVADSFDSAASGSGGQIGGVLENGLHILLVRLDARLAVGINSHQPAFNHRSEHEHL